MLKKTITYKNYFGDDVTEDFYFNISKSDFMDWENSVEGGMTTQMQKYLNRGDKPALSNFFKELILKAYGEISPDGRRFMQSKEISQAFKETPAYDILYMELATNDVEAQKFIEGIFPMDWSNEIAKARAKSKDEAPIAIAATEIK